MSSLPPSLKPDWRINERIEVASKTDKLGVKTYTLVRLSERAYDCNCWSFITGNKGKDRDKKTCKHIREALGDAHETARIGQPANLTKAQEKAMAKAAAASGAASGSGSASTSASASTSIAAPAKRPALSSTSTPTSTSPKKPRLSADLSTSAAATTSTSKAKGKKGKGKQPEEEEEEGEPAELLLAQSFDIMGGKEDPTGLLMSEKLDGVRAYWDGVKTLWSRTRKPFTVPEGFLSHFPYHTTLDGELYIGRDRFDETSGLVRTTKSHWDDDVEERWKEVKYMVFDIPSLGTEPFTTRLAKLHELYPSTAISDNEEENVVQDDQSSDTNSLDENEHEDHPNPIQVVAHEMCKGIEHLKERLEEVVNANGEGLMLRDPDSVYVSKRDKSLKKVKLFYDAEARVVGYEGGKGKYEGLTGSLLCEMEDGTQFSVGSGLTDERRGNPPAIGAIITYRFQELSQNDVPRFPTFVGERADADEPKDAVVRSAAAREAEASSGGGSKGKGKGKGKAKAKGKAKPKAKPKAKAKASGSGSGSGRGKKKA